MTKSTGKGKATGKKRNRSKATPDSKTSKRSKPESGMPDTPKSPDVTEESVANSQCTSDTRRTNGTPVPYTPKEKLDFSQDGDDTKMEKSPEMDYPDAPKWAKDLMEKLERVENLAKDTQKTITVALQVNTDTSNKVKALTKRVCDLEQENISVKNEKTDLHERLLLLEFHQRRNNLVFDGIPEVDGPESGRDCYFKLIEILSYLPDLDVSGVRIERCHRLGARQKFRTRSIIAKFDWYGDVMDILEQRSYLPSGVFVSEMR